MKNVIMLDESDIKTQRNFNHFEIHTTDGPIINLTMQAVLELRDDLNSFIEDTYSDKPQATG